VFLKLLLLFTVTPAVELYLLIKLGQIMGAAETVLLIVLTGIVGATLAKREGFAVLNQINAEARAGFPSGDRLVEGLMVLVGGLLLLTPGILTDLFGFTLIMPPTRRAAAPLIKAALLKRVQLQGFTPGPVSPGPAARGPAPTSVSDASGPGAGDPHFDHPTF
jgi:UPF0716 protein FxsA